MIYSPEFLIYINRILGHEGGYVNDPQDPGGETNWGISKRSYPQLDIRNLSKDEAIAIYYTDFYKPVIEKGIIYPSVAYQLLDFAVNSGMGTATRYYQRALGVADDGHIGPYTVKAIHAMSESDQLMRLVAQRISFMTKLKNWKAHGRGWMVRMADNLNYAAADTKD